MGGKSSIMPMIVVSSHSNFIFVENIHLGPLYVGLQEELSTINGYLNIFVPPIPDKLQILPKITNYLAILRHEFFSLK